MPARFRFRHFPTGLSGNGPRYFFVGDTSLATWRRFAGFEPGRDDARDVVKAFVHAMENAQGMNGEPYDVGRSEANFSKIEPCERFKKHVPDFTCVEARYDE